MFVGEITELNPNSDSFGVRAKAAFGKLIYSIMEMQLIEHSIFCLSTMQYNSTRDVNYEFDV